MILALLFGAALFAAPPTFQAQGGIAADASPGTDLTVTLPAHAADDIIIVMAFERSILETVTIDTPAGYAAIAGSPFDRGLLSRYWLWWKRAASSADGNPVLNTDGVTLDLYGIAYTIRGARATGNPIEVVSTPTTGTADPATNAGLTSLTAESLIVMALGGEDNNNAACTTTGTDPSAYVEHYVETGTGADFMFCFSEAPRTTAGSTGTVSLNFDVATPVGWGSVVLAVIPPAAAAGAADTFNDGTW